MKKPVFFIIILLFINAENIFSQVSFKSSSFGIPACPAKISYIQPDGSELIYYQKGDAVVNWKETSGGYVIMKNDEGSYCYATRKSDNSLSLSGVIAGSNKTLPANAVKGNPYSYDEINILRSSYLKENDISSARSFPSTGVNNLLLILIEFPDTSHTYDTTTFLNMFNLDNYNNTGSFSQFYLENSYGLLNMVTVVRGWYTAPEPHDYYGNDQTDYYDKVKSLVRFGVDQAELQGIDFNQFDNNHDSIIDGVMVIHQGRGAETGDNSCIWSHSSNLGDTYQVTYDSVLIRDYTINPEISGGNDINGIGTACHEFGHNLGVADYYDTNYGTTGQSEHLGEWDLMASGSYNNDSNTPAHHNAYSRNKLGWLTIQELDATATNVMLLKLENNPVAYKYMTTTPGEFFMLENRQKVGFDQYIPGHGMLIYHIDENHHGSWNADASHQAFDLEEADATDSHGAGDAFPAGNTLFTDLSNPSSVAWSGFYTNRPVTDIIEVADTVYFNFMQLDQPPVAHFFSDKHSVCEGTEITFTENSAYFADTVLWYFEGGIPSTSTNPYQTVYYDSSGTFDVTLIVSNAFGTDTLTSVQFIEVGVPQEYSLIFDGSNDRVVIPPLNLHSDTVTIEAWVRLLLYQNDWSGIVFCRGDSTVAGLSIRDNNELRYHWNGGNYDWSSGLIIPNSTWTHVALVVTSDHATIYMDDTSATNYAVHDMEEFSSVLKIGHDLGDRYLKGLVDEVRIWKSIRTPEQFEFYKCSIPDPQAETDLIAYYTFNECKGFILRDSKSGFDGNLENMAENDWVVNYPCMPGSVPETEKNLSFKIFPNPGDGVINISTEGYGEKIITVYNGLGETLLSEKFNDKIHLLDLKIFPSGIYLIKLTDKNGTEEQKIIIQK